MLQLLELKLPGDTIKDEYQNNTNQCKFLLIIISKCKLLHIGLDDYPSSYTLNGNVIKTVCSMRDLGVQINSSLKFHQYTSITVNKANRVLSKSFTHLDACMLSALYRSLV